MKNFTQEEINQIIDLYTRQNKSCNWIAKEMNCFHTKISKILKERNLLETKENRLEKYKKKCNEHFFQIIDSEEKAYWLGFLYADGNLFDGKQKGLQICLSSLDKDHLECFSKTIQNEYSIGTYNYKNEVVQLRIPSEKMFYDLINCGCFPRKTFLIQPPSESILNEKLIRHFIRGYFDGDGCKSSKHIIFLGTEELLNWISSKIPIEHKTRVIKPNGKNIYRLGISAGSLHREKAIYDFLYKDATVFLERKRVKFPSAFTQAWTIPSSQEEMA